MHNKNQIMGRKIGAESTSKVYSILSDKELKIAGAASL